MFPGRNHENRSFGVISVLLLGLLIGMKHALEADHIAAVASLASRSRTLGSGVRLGVAWGIGHTVTLFVVGATVLSFDAVIPASVAQWLEFAVGIMLILLGADVLRRMMRARAHFHLHDHGPSTHFHAHAHAGENRAEAASHEHDHPKGLQARAVVVGLVHGMAGSAALVLLTLNSIDSVWLGVGYILVFGFGSILGMAALSLIVVFPLMLTARRLTWAFNGLTAVAGVVTVILGTMISFRFAVAAGIF